MLRRVATCLIAVMLTCAAAGAKPPRRATRHKARSVSTKQYQAMVRDWHSRKPGASAPRDAEGRPKLVLEAINTRERIELTAARDDGGFSAVDLDRAAQRLRDAASGNELPGEPTLIDVHYRLQRRFDAPAVRVISGYRTGRGTGASRHAHGAAADIVIPGAKDQDVAEYARSLGSTGVGLYPRAGYVHVDVRTTSYFWRDASGPGQRSRPRSAPKRRSPKHDAKRSKPLPPARASAIPGSDVGALLERGSTSPRAPADAPPIDDHPELPGPAAASNEDSR